MSKVILSLALCLSSSVRAQTGRGLAKDNLSSGGGQDWSQRRRLDGPMDDVCEGGGPSHRFESRLECCENLDAYDLNTFCTGSCPPTPAPAAAGCMDIGGVSLGVSSATVDLKTGGCVKISDGRTFDVYDGPWDIEVTSNIIRNHKRGISIIEFQSGAHDVALDIPGGIYGQVRGAADNLAIDIKAGGELKGPSYLSGANNKLDVQFGGTLSTTLWVEGDDSEIDIKGFAQMPIHVKGQNSHIHIHDTATFHTSNPTIHVSAEHSSGYPNGNGLTLVNNGPINVGIYSSVVGTSRATGVTCNGLAVSFDNPWNSYTCAPV